MEITRISILSNKVHSMDINITQQELDLYYSENGPLLQVAFPNLSNEEREFIKSGICPEEWNELFGENN